MKKRFLSGIMFLLSLGAINCGVSSINNLNWMDVSAKRFAPQVMFDFAQPLYFEKKIDKDKLLLEIAFPGMNLRDFEKQKVVEKLKSLGSNMIKSVEVCSKNVPCPRVVVSITFMQKDILIRWNKMDDPNRLIFDIFSKKSLKELDNKGAVLLYAQNDIFKSDVNPLAKSLAQNNNVKKNVRILVDPGHGGLDPGAKGFFFQKEKDVALDIALRATNLLKKNGFNTYLTRNTDKDLTLLERSELANQLKADLFVSIHVNAVQGVESANGVESYHLSKNKLLPPKRRGGYLFTFNEQDVQLTKVADNMLGNNINLSKKLAENIQNSIVGFLKSKNVSVLNRGVKENWLRVLLRSEIPVVLIEVGFLTNKKEAQRLANASYKQMLAEGIYRGIQGYITQNQ